jgi:hypothetical protein
MHTRTAMTTQPVSACQTTQLKPEFGRIRDVEHLYGLKRGTTYNLLASGRIRGCTLRVKGKKSGVRLIDLESVGQYIRAQMDQQNNAADSGLGFKSLEAAEAPVTGGSATASREDSNPERAAEVLRTSSAASRKSGRGFIARAAALMDRQLKKEAV